MNVNFRHPTYRKFLARWKIVRDVINADAQSHLRTIDKEDDTISAAYKEDAILTNFTNRTKTALVGSVFKDKPQADLPKELEYVLKDATGDNFTLDQLSKQSVGEVLITGRIGLLTDFPFADNNERTVKKVEEEDLKGRIYVYKAESIIHWNIEIVNGKNTVTLIVLEEITDKLAGDGFTSTELVQYRVLRLIAGVYIQELYDADGVFIMDIPVVGFDNKILHKIPFSIAGAEDNNMSIDNSPLYGLALLNIAHYKNSADEEDYLHTVGSPTMVVTSSMSPEQWKEATGGKLHIGAKNALNLGMGGTAQFLQVSPTQAISEAMKRKEEQAVMLGARLITPSSGIETAEAARIRHGSEISVLSTIVRNVEDAIISSLKFLAVFEGANEEEIEYKLNDKFFDDKMDPQEIMAQIQLLDRNIISKEDIRTNLRSHGVIDPERTDEEIDESIDEAGPDIEFTPPVSSTEE